jgi:hypothetical protein
LDDTELCGDVELQSWLHHTVTLLWMVAACAIVAHVQKRMDESSRLKSGLMLVIKRHYLHPSDPGKMKQFAHIWGQA